MRNKAKHRFWVLTTVSQMLSLCACDLDTSQYRITDLKLLAYVRFGYSSLKFRLDVDSNPFHLFYQHTDSIWIWWIYERSMHLKDKIPSHYIFNAKLWRILKLMNWKALLCFAPCFWCSQKICSCLLYFKAPSDLSKVILKQ